MIRYAAAACLTVAILALGYSEEKKPQTLEDVLKAMPRTKPLEPAEAAKAFDVRPGFRVELVASEPLIRSPVAMDFDENGRLYVTEFVEYNQYANPGFKDHGSVKLLEDTDGDGRFDKSTVFADNLDSPVAVACWDGGVYVGVVPDLWYFKDTNGDGKADIKRKVLTGFEKDRSGEGMLNSFHWGPDNRLHISTSLAGGNLRHADRPNDKPVSVRRQNIRFDPRGETFELTSGGGQHGMTLDDWGDTFVCDNSNPIHHLVYDGRYLLKNPYVEAPSPVVDINAAGRYPNLHRISPPEPWREARTKLRKDKLFQGSDEGGKPFGFFTGATGVTVYRGDAFPAEFKGNAFVGEIANNLVYRAKLEPKGLTWSAVRAEQGREFLALRDNWFRPVQFANGPDGCLYVVDMYRELIEGAAFLPPQMLKYVDVAGGLDRGRIWRIVPEPGKYLRNVKLGQATTAELVETLEHANGWHRDTASRLLYQRQDKAAVGPLRKLQLSKNAQGRLHARVALEGLGAFRDTDVSLLQFRNEATDRVQVLQLLERLPDKQPAAAYLARNIGEWLDDPNVRVRRQFVLTTGEVCGPERVPWLVKFAVKDGADPWFRLALLTAAGDQRGAFFNQVLAHAELRPSPTGKALIASLLAQITASQRANDLSAAFYAIENLPAAEKAYGDELIRTILAKLPPSGRAAFAEAGGGRAGVILLKLVADARKTVATTTAPEAARVAAVRTLAFAPFAEVKAMLADCLKPSQASSVQVAAVESLGRFADADVPPVLLAAWPGMSPQIRATATETLLSRPTWVSAFLTAVEKGTVRPADLDPARVQLLVKSTDEKIRTRAAKLFAGNALSKRADVIAKYQPALQLTGDAAKGKLVFKNVCSACHKLEGVGNAVGPDLMAIKQRGTDSVLTNILDPNREVLPQYFTYNVTTDEGVTLTGLITTETANTVTLRKADGSTATVQRANIESLRSTGLSAMPEGLEQQIDAKSMADLLAYLNGLK